MKHSILLLICFLATFISNAVTFDVDGLRYNIISMTDKTVEVAIIPKSISYPSYSTYKGDIVIPEKVVYNDVTFDVIGIGDHAFSNSSITSVSIPNSVKYIGLGAFSYAYKFSNIDLPDNLTSIDAAAFRDTYITEITIPNSVTELGSTIFMSCPYLKSVVLPNGISEIKEDMFDGCKALETIQIPNSVTSIGSHAFMNTSNLKECVIPSGVTNIGNGCFYGSGVTAIIIPERVTQLGTSTFYNCRNLETVVMPQRLESLGKECFRNCSKLKSIIIPEGVTKIESYTFEYCLELTSVTLPSTLISIGNNAFSHCNKLTSLIIPIGVTKIYSEAFYDTSLSYLSLPSTLEEIGGWAFGIADMEELVLPASLKKIGSYAFDDSAIGKVVCLSSTPLECEENIFHNDTYLKGKLIIPCGSKEAYSSVVPWSSFFFVEEDITLDIDHIYSDLDYYTDNNTIYFNSEVLVSIYTQEGKCLSTTRTICYTFPNRGIYFVKFGNKIIKVLI